MMKKIFLGTMALLAVFVFLGAGCNDPTHGEGGPGPEPGKESAQQTKSDISDVCKYFPKELVEEAIGRPIVRAADDSMVSDACSYYTEYSETYDHTPNGDKPGGPNIVVVLNNKNEADDKADFEKKGYAFSKDESYSWNHYLVTSRGSKTPFRVDLIVDEGNYFMIKSNHFAATDEEIVKIGKRLSERMKNGN